MSKLLNILGLIFFILFSEQAFSSCEQDLINAFANKKIECSQIPCGSFYLGPDFMEGHNPNDTIFGCLISACQEGVVEGGSFWTVYKCPSQIPEVEDKNLDIQTLTCGSIIKTESQQLGESIPVVGAGMALNYFTLWSKAYKENYRFSIPAVLATFPTSITQVNITVSSSDGVYETQTFYPSGVDVDYTFSWNGLDLLGIPVNGTKEFTISVSQISGSLVIPSKSVVKLGSFDAFALGLGGWVPSNAAYYDHVGKKLYKGDGSVRLVGATPYTSGQYMVPEQDGSLVYIFDSNGRLLNIKSGILGTTVLSFNYDSSGRLTSSVDAFSRTTTYVRNGSGKLVSIIAPKGQTSSVTLDSNGYLSALVNPNSESFNMTYSSQGLLTSFTKPGLQNNVFTYDSDGYLIHDGHSGGYYVDIVRTINQASTDILVNTTMGRSTQLNYFGDISSATFSHIDPAGRQSSRAYYKSPDSNQFTSYEYGVSSSSTTYKDERFLEGAYYEASKSVSSSISGYTINQNLNFVLNDPDNPFSISSLSKSIQKDSLTLNNVFNPVSKEWTQTSGLGRTTKVGIDNYERIISQKVGNLNSTTFAYTGADLTAINQGSRQTLLSYNVITGFLESITNALGQTTSFVYDAAGRVVSKVFPDSRVIGYSYDSNGKLTGVTPPGRSIHSFGFNSSEIISGYQPPVLSGVSLVNTTYSYNSDKQLTSVSRPDGAVINFYYNATTGDLETYETPSGIYSQSIDFTSGLPSYITTPSGISTSITYNERIMGDTSSYDSNSNLLGTYSKIFASTGLVQSDTVSNPVGVTSVINYLYDNDEYLKKAGDVNLTYNFPNGQLTGTAMGTGSAGFTDTYTYNTYNEIVGYTAKRGTTIIYDLVLSRDSIGRVVGKTQSMNSINNEYVYSFDIVGRLGQVTKNSAVVSNYGYDSNSNRNSGNIGAQTTLATYDDQDRLLTYNMLSFSYNANGDLNEKTNTLTNTSTQYTYDVFGNLTQVILPNGTTTITYEIDGLNRRIGKKVNGVLQKRWIYMDQYRIAAELNASGTITKRFIYGSKSNIPDYMIASGVKYRIISDHLGSPRLVVKQSDGTILQRMDHDEFGRVIEDTNPGYLPFGFAGGLYDNQTGLVRFGARDYDSETGRWTSKDPILFNGGDTNLFGYVANDPVNWVDPTGLRTLPGIRGTGTQVGIAGGIVGGIIGSVVPGVGTAIGLVGGAAVGAIIGKVIGDIANSIGGEVKIGADTISGGIIGGAIVGTVGSVGGATAGGVLIGGAAGAAYCSEKGPSEISDSLQKIIGGF